jgi:Mlc titration factor MtfA (ptsG expression regulator)
MNNIQDEIDLVGESAASIDAYAATDPGECFAVLSEYFFSAPELFAPRFPALWQRFCLFYRQDPLERLRENTRRMTAITRQYTKTTTCTKFSHLNQQVKFSVDTKIRDQ